MSVILTRDDGLVLQLDGYESIRYDNRIRVTSHAIETGATITDHAQEEPTRFTVVGALFTPAQTVTPRPLAVTEAISFFETAAGKLIAVDTVRDGTLLNCFLTAWPHAQTVMKGRTFDLSFERIAFATPIAVVIPPRIPSVAAGAGMADEADAGAQATAAATASSTATAPTSFGAAAFDLLLGEG